jgi:hypothetical protein
MIYTFFVKFQLQFFTFAFQSEILPYSSLLLSRLSETHMCVILPQYCSCLNSRLKIFKKKNEKKKRSRAQIYPEGVEGKGHQRSGDEKRCKPKKKMNFCGKTATMH